MADILARQRQIVGTVAEWEAHDLLLGDGEFAIERQEDGTVMARVGDGSLAFSDSPYLGGMGGGGGGGGAMVGVVTPEQFGATGGNSALDTAAFQAVRAAGIAAGANATMMLHCYPGRTYLIADPWWPCDIRNLIVNGNGCTLKNTATDPKDFSLLNTATGTNAAKNGSFFIPVDKLLINTTNFGDQSVFCKTAADAARFAAGDSIMIASWDLQFAGAPDNYRQFEFHRVLLVNAGTGEIKIDGRIKHAHYDNFPYRTGGAGSEGRAHVEVIDTGSKFGVQHVYNDIIFAPNDAGPGASVDAVFCVGESIELNRGEAPYIMASIAQSVRLNECQITETDSSAVEVLDKLVTNFTATGCTFYGRLSTGAGVQRCTLIRCRLEDGYSLNPHFLEMKDCDVFCTTAAKANINTSNGFTQRLVIDGGRHSFHPNYSTVAGQTNTLVLGSGKTWSAATQTLTIDTTVAANRNWLVLAFPGQYVWNSISAAGSEHPAGNFGIVQSVTGDSDSADIVIHWQGTNTLAAAERLTIYHEPWYTRSSFAEPRDYVVFAHTTFKHKARFGSGYTFPSIKVMGRPTKITMDVIEETTTSTPGNVNFSLVSYYPTYGAGRTVDLKTAGRREAACGYNAGFTGTGGESAAANLAAAKYLTDFWGQCSLEAGAFATVDATGWPVVEVTVQFESPYNRIK